jgi:signal transduction histidine kinase
MKEKNKESSPNDYKVVMSDLGTSPFRTIKAAFALMAVIPLLVIFYVIIGRHFLYDLFLGNDGLAILIGILVSLAGLLYAYDLINKLMKRLLKYAIDRKIADNEKTELIMTVTHDLKSPVSVIKLSMQNLLDGLGGSLNKIQGDIVKVCLNAVENMLKFIEDMTNFSKSGLARMFMRRQLIDLSNVILKEVDAIKRLAEQNELNLDFKRLNDDTRLWADENKITRVVTNLLSNAVKYTPRGGKVRAVLSSDDSTVRFSIINTGPGISGQDLNRIFKKYERLAEHSDVEGMGLGLSIVKDIVDMHHGRITVKSEPGSETEFNVILPRDLRSVQGIKNNAHIK